MDPMLKNGLGTATVSVSQVVAGEYATISYVFKAGHSIDDSGFLKIAFRSVADFGTPQFGDPAAAHYCRLIAPHGRRLIPRWDVKGHLRPWDQALFVQIKGGFLDQGEEIELIFGDTSGGSAGWRVQSFCEAAFQFKTFVDPYATCSYKELPESPVMRIVAGPVAQQQLVAPAQVKAGKKFYAHLRSTDRWGNPVGKVARVGLVAPEAVGVFYARLTEHDPSLVSNPVLVKAAEEDGLIRAWADFHGQSGETVGTGSIEDYFRFARDHARLDIAAHQGNDFQISDAFWEKVNRICRHFNRNHRFVTFPGYEWSGNTPLGGDRNVYFAAEGGPIYRSSMELVEGGSKWPCAPTAKDLFRKLGGPGLPTAFVFAHVGGRYADLRTHEDGLEVAVEIHSAWGTFEWFAREALQRDLLVGFCANSDDHKARPGAALPGADEFGSLGGLTCVLVQELSRKGVLEAMRSRHFYATTGARLYLDLQIELKNGVTAMMGDIIKHRLAPDKMTFSVAGMSPVERVELWGREGLIEKISPWKKPPRGGRIKIMWIGAENRGRSRAVKWDGTLRVKGNRWHSWSPIHLFNPAHLPWEKGKNQLFWESRTTGNSGGLILELEKAATGNLEISTAQGRWSVALAQIVERPFKAELGALGKQIEVYAIPESAPEGEFRGAVALPRNMTRQREAYYVKACWLDGHCAWSSPIYVEQD